MKGYKTWIAVVGFFLLGIYEILNGNFQQAFQYFMTALALLGIGSKIEKNFKSF